MSCPAVWHSEYFSECQGEAQQIYFHKLSILAFTMVFELIWNFIKNCFGFISDVADTEIKGRKIGEKFKRKNDRSGGKNAACREHKSHYKSASRAAERWKNKTKKRQLQTKYAYKITIITTEMYMLQFNTN